MQHPSRAIGQLAEPSLHEVPNVALHFSTPDPEDDLDGKVYDDSEVDDELEDEEGFEGEEEEFGIDEEDFDVEDEEFDVAEEGEEIGFDDVDELDADDADGADF